MDCIFHGVPKSWTRLSDFDLQNIALFCSGIFPLLFFSVDPIIFGYAVLNMPANLENSALATGLEKVSFHSDLKERQCQIMLKLLHNCTHLTR